MNKEIFVKLGIKLLKVVGWAGDVAAVSGGLFVALNAIDKRTNRKSLKSVAKLAFDRGLKEGEIQELYRIDRGIPFIAGQFVIDVAMYVVVKINDDGQYKMRYVGSRSVTKEELELLDL